MQKNWPWMLTSNVAFHAAVSSDSSGPGGPRDAGVVDEDVQAAQFRLDQGHQVADLILVGDVADGGGEAVDAGLLDGVGVNVRDEDGGAERLELGGDGQADAVGPGGDQHPL